MSSAWQAEVMYRLFDVRKFEMVKAALGEQLAAVKNMLLGFSAGRASGGVPLHTSLLALQDGKAK